MTVLSRPAGYWTVWNDGDGQPLDQAATRQEAERLLLGYPDHDYAYIQSPAGEQYTWNPFRESWERI